MIEDNKTGRPKGLLHKINGQAVSSEVWKAHLRNLKRTAKQSAQEQTAVLKGKIEAYETFDEDTKSKFKLQDYLTIIK